MHPELRTILDELKRELETIYGDRLVRMVLYGSQARGDAQPDSDIDVLVVLQGDVDPFTEIKRTGYAVSDVSLRHTVCIQCAFRSDDDFATQSTSFLRNVQREGIAV